MMVNWIESKGVETISAVCLGFDFHCERDISIRMLFNNRLLEISIVELKFASVLL